MMENGFRSEPVFNTSGMRTLEERFMNEYGISSLVLMERAALAVAEEIPKDAKVLCLCGSGKNGADGLAVARILRERGIFADVFLVPFAKCSREYEAEKHLLSAFLGGTVYDDYKTVTEKLSEYTVLVDAVFGIGCNRAITGELFNLIGAVNSLGKPVISVDIPSGIETDSGKVLGIAVKASKTVTFSFVKPGLLLYPGRTYAGQVITKRIGIPEETDVPYAFTTGFFEAGKLFPKRPAFSNKGTFGKIAVISGSKDMPGAATMVTKACYRSGGGVVTLFSEESVLSVVRETVPEVITRDYLAPENAAGILSGFTSIVIGPGLGTSGKAKALVNAVLAVKSIPTVWDADALNCISLTLPERNTDTGLSTHISEQLRLLSEMFTENAVLTPHKKELSRLLGVSVSEINDHVIEWLPELKALPFVLVMKDSATIVVGQGNAYINKTGNSGMATGGSGDVLSGILGAFLCLEKPFDAAVRGVFVHGLCGDDAANRLSETSMMAGDLLDSVCYLSKRE